MADHPILVEVLRGGVVESGHRGAVVVCDAGGGIVGQAGDIDRPIFPRSAIKVAQGLPLVESGAADAYGFGDRELAMVGASHNGEAGHAETARAMLERAGLSPQALECGTQWPSRRQDVEALARAGTTACPLHNNCSGKHAGFLCTAVHEGIAPNGYVGYDHAIQRMGRAVMSDVFGCDLGAAEHGVDGCSIPTYAIPLQNLARGFAKMGTGAGLQPQRAKAARRLIDAAMTEPWYMAGTGRFCTDFMTVLDRTVYAKTGAEGVFCGAIPALGLGIAVKADDGAGRAAEVIMAATVAALLGRADDPALARFIRPRLTNWNGIEVGALRPAHA